MISKAMVLCMSVILNSSSCVEEYADGNELILPEAGKHLDFNSRIPVRNSSRFLGMIIHKIGDVVEMAEKNLLNPLLILDEAVNTTDFIEHAGEKLIKSIVKGVGKGLKQGWEEVQTMKAPGKKYIMMFPNAMIAVADVAAQKAWFLVSATGEAILANTAWDIYTTLNIISFVLGPIMRGLHMDCFKFRNIKSHVGKFVAEDIVMKDINICGFATLRATRNVKITKDKGSLMVIVVPFIIDTLTAKIRAVNVTDYSGLLLENTPMTAKIKRTYVKSEIFFTRGTILRFMTMKMRIQKFGNLDLKVDVAEEDRTNAMDIAEGISDALSPVVVKSVNQRFRRFEKRMAKLLGAKTSKASKKHQ